ncbi:hypothetical protein [Vulgatibacter sp.]|uniref:hypothetical protein n=1 Tax=Vulgatibacter sp. TaxID=1971226 RepID=UPI003568CD1C
MATTAERQVVETACENAAEFEALELWLDAQTWLSPLTEAGEREVAVFAGVLGDSLSDDDEILAALLALAHSSCAAARRVLEDYVATPHPGFDYVAKLALEEWLFWAERTPVEQVA